MGKMRIRSLDGATLNECAVLLQDDTGNLSAGRGRCWIPPYLVLVKDAPERHEPRLLGMSTRIKW